jgi:hypothetical protein
MKRLCGVGATSVIGRAVAGRPVYAGAGGWLSDGIGTGGTGTGNGSDAPAPGAIAIITKKIRKVA